MAVSRMPTKCATLIKDCTMLVINYDDTSDVRRAINLNTCCVTFRRARPRGIDELGEPRLHAERELRLWKATARTACEQNECTNGIDAR